MAIQRTGRGVSRVLQQVFPLLLKTAIGPDTFILTTEEGADLLGPVDGEIVLVQRQPKTTWEQIGLPWHSRINGADRLYTHSECGPLWGVKTLLHIPEDPYVRWSTAPITTPRERVRRHYQRATMAASIRAATRIAVSCTAIAEQLVHRFGPAGSDYIVVPLGVDTSLFYPDTHGQIDPGLFHLGSDEPRDQTLMLVHAYASALAIEPQLPDLTIAGNLGAVANVVTEAATALDITGHIHLLGRVDDSHLRRLYSRATICIQPARYEGFGLQPLEALACGAPLLVYPDPAVQEVVGTAAALIPGRTQSDLACAIVDLWRDEPLRASCRTTGPARAATFTWTSTAKLLAQLLQDIASDRPPFRA